MPSSSVNLNQLPNKSLKLRKNQFNSHLRWRRLHSPHLRHHQHLENLAQLLSNLQRKKSLLKQTHWPKEKVVKLRHSNERKRQQIDGI